MDERCRSCKVRADEEGHGAVRCSAVRCGAVRKAWRWGWARGEQPEEGRTDINQVRSLLPQGLPAAPSFLFSTLLLALPSLFPLSSRLSLKEHAITPGHQFYTLFFLSAYSQLIANRSRLLQLPYRPFCCREITSSQHGRRLSSR